MTPSQSLTVDARALLDAGLKPEEALRVLGGPADVSARAVAEARNGGGSLPSLKPRAEWTNPWAHARSRLHWGVGTEELIDELLKQGVPRDVAQRFLLSLGSLRRAQHRRRGLAEMLVGGTLLGLIVAMLAALHVPAAPPPPPAPPVTVVQSRRRPPPPQVRMQKPDIPNFGPAVLVGLIGLAIFVRGTFRVALGPATDESDTQLDD